MKKKHLTDMELLSSVIMHGDAAYQVVTATAFAFLVSGVYSN